MIECSLAYIEDVKRQLAKMEAQLSPDPLKVVRELSDDFKQNCTKMRVWDEPKP